MVKYFDIYGIINYFNYDSNQSIDGTRMILKDIHGYRLLFTFPCMLWKPDYEERELSYMRTVQIERALPLYLGFKDYTDYQMYFENYSNQCRKQHLREILSGSDLTCCNLPDNVANIFKTDIQDGKWDIVPKNIDRPDDVNNISLMIPNTEMVWMQKYQETQEHVLNQGYDEATLYDKRCEVVNNILFEIHQKM